LPPDVEVGAPGLLRSYSEWGYQPNVVEVNPLASAATPEDFAGYTFPDVTADYRYAGLAELVAASRAAGYPIAGGPPRLGGELFETAYRLRGFQQFLSDLGGSPALADYLLDQLEAIMRHNVGVLARAGVDVLILDDDVAMPTGLIISPKTWCRHFKPRLARIIRAARAARPDIRVLYHSDGDYSAIVPDLIEVGVDALNPVQPDHMDPAALKRQFGDAVAIWGAVGSQGLFGKGTPAQIRDEVRRRIDELAPGGGYVAAPAYDVDHDLKWENIVAFAEACHEFGGY
jgi:uroporphyrinogen decarboxylase